MHRWLELLQKKPALWQMAVLGRHFFLRYFSGDLLAYEEQRREKLIVFLTSLAVVSLALSSKLYFPYLISGLSGRVVSQIWQEKLAQVTYFQIMLGVISVFSWNGMFPDRRDYQNLLCQPIGLGTVLLAKLGSQLAFIAMATLAAALPSGLVLAFYTGNITGTNFALYLLMQLFVFFLAGMFVYFWIFSIQGLLLLVLPHRMYQRLSVFVQILLLGGFVLLFSFSGRLIPEVLAAKKQYAGLGIFFPPLWFVGLGEGILGSHDTIYSIHSRLAWLGLALPLALYSPLFSFSYQRHLRELPESAPHRSGGLRHHLSRLLGTRFLRSPAQRAIYDFVQQCQKYSRTHRFILGLAVIIPLCNALVWLSDRGRAGASLQLEDWHLLSLTVVFIPFIVLGLRLAVSVPLALEANWVWKLHFPDAEKHSKSGMNLAFWKNHFYPLLLLSFLLCNFAGGVTAALLLTCYDAALLFLFQEWAFLTYGQIPFTASSKAATHNIKVFWPFHLFGFLGYTFLFTYLKKRLLTDPIFIIPIAAAFFAAHLLCRAALARRRSFDLPLAYDEDPEPVMLSLDIE